MWGWGNDNSGADYIIPNDHDTNAEHNGNTNDHGATNYYSYNDDRYGYADATPYIYRNTRTHANGAARG